MRPAPIFLDCPPFLHDLYDDGLAGIVPDLEIHVGEPGPDELVRLLRGRAFAMNDHSKLDRAVLAACPDLRCVVFLGTGAASYIDLEAARDLGITVRSYKGYGDRSVAEHAFALMLAACRRIAAMDAAIRAGGWETRDGIELLGKTLGVIGTGGIGAQMVRLAHGFGMEVLAWNRSGVDPALPCRPVELETLLATADIVSLHLLLSPATRGFLDARRIGAIKPGAILVNTARGAVLDEAALVAALADGRIGHAALDVFAEEPLPAGHPLRALPNVTLTAHAAFMTPEASARLLRMALEILAAERAAS